MTPSDATLFNELFIDSLSYVFFDKKDSKLNTTEIADKLPQFYAPLIDSGIKYLEKRKNDIGI
jgi:hypothetical protein